MKLGKFSLKEFSNISKVFGGQSNIVDTPVITTNRTGEDNNRADPTEKDDIGVVAGVVSSIITYV